MNCGLDEQWKHLGQCKLSTNSTIENQYDKCYAYYEKNDEKGCKWKTTTSVWYFFTCTYWVSNCLVSLTFPQGFICLDNQ